MSTSDEKAFAALEEDLERVASTHSCTQPVDSAGAVFVTPLNGNEVLVPFGADADVKTLLLATQVELGIKRPLQLYTSDGDPLEAGTLAENGVEDGHQLTAIISGHVTEHTQLKPMSPVDQENFAKKHKMPPSIGPTLQECSSDNDFTWLCAMPVNHGTGVHTFTVEVVDEGDKAYIGMAHPITNSALPFGLDDLCIGVALNTRGDLWEYGGSGQCVWRDGFHTGDILRLEVNADEVLRDQTFKANTPAAPGSRGSWGRHEITADTTAMRIFKKRLGLGAPGNHESCWELMTTFDYIPDGWHFGVGGSGHGVGFRILEDDECVPLTSA